MGIDLAVFTVPIHRSFRPHFGPGVQRGRQLRHLRHQPFHQRCMGLRELVGPFGGLFATRVPQDRPCALHILDSRQPSYDACALAHPKWTRLSVMQHAF
jgi:hypothetical protein